MTTRTLNQSTSAPTVGFLHWKDAKCSYLIEVGPMLSLGRESTNHVVLEDDYASARHARIEQREDGFYVRDLKSRNGTFVNGTRAYEVRLSDNDKIQIGQIELVFSYEKAGQSLNELTSKNVIWNAQLQRLPGMAQSPFPILISGPSGSGKDVLAQYIHRKSSRREGPFVGVNCSALSESLVESELFGHVRGSFTGASSDRKGAFEAARGGTLFLDEIGDLPLNLQPKLLRALENNQIQPLGSDRSILTDVRIVAATHKDLKRAVYEGQFRADLYFRLSVLQMRAPALSERKEDFEDIFYSLARDMQVRFSHDAIDRLKKHNWPGNVRELKNVLARAKAIYSKETVDEFQVEPLLDRFPEGGQTLASPSAPQIKKSSSSVIKEIEFEMIKSRLLANQGNQRRTAADLGMAKSTLHDKMKAYGIDVEILLNRAL